MGLRLGDNASTAVALWCGGYGNVDTLMVNQLRGGAPRAALPPTHAPIPPTLRLCAAGLGAATVVATGDPSSVAVARAAGLRVIDGLLMRAALEPKCVREVVYFDSDVGLSGAGGYRWAQPAAPLLLTDHR
eukprot:gene30974-37644_t